MPRKYLIVDDSPVIRLTLQKLLARTGVKEDQILTADGGEEAYKLFQSERPEVVFMDMMMPGVDGEQAAQLMLNEDPECKIIIVTGTDPADERVRRLVSLGAYHVIEKPVRAEDVRGVMSLLDQEEGGAGRIR